MLTEEEVMEVEISLDFKDEKFAKQAYNFAQHYFTKDEFEKFVNLRKPYKDAFCPENEHAPER